jgi:hypothetical protein
MHWRATSTSQVNIRDASSSSSSGYFEAKDENATISKSAAKRLERVLQGAGGSSGASPAHSRTAASTIFADSHRVRSLRRTSAQPGLSGVQDRLGMPAGPSSSTLTPPPSTLGTSLSLSLSSDASDDLHPTTPSITSESGPSSGMSSRAEEDGDEGEEVLGGEAGAVEIVDANCTENTWPLNRPFLTPLTPCDDLPTLEDVHSPHHYDPHQGHKRSASSMRSPNPAVASRQTSHSSYISESALGQMTLDEEGRASATSSNQNNLPGGSKGALEALRKLSGGSNSGHHLQPSAPSSTSRWAGSLASWVGMSNTAA